MSKSSKKFNIAKTPVVAVLGHVDHGKTTFLDAIRNTNVQEKEAGGITQNTRAHEVEYEGQKITFIDTPGHKAFSEMRSRGASVTDIVLLIIAADDGVLPQTVESIQFAKKSNTPIIIGINKIDLPGADVPKIKNQLSQNDVLVEEYGGDVQVFEISAIKKEGLNELLEGILLQAEIMELKPNKPAIGVSDAVVLESKLDNKLGSVALVLVKSGKISTDDYVIYNEKFSGIRVILDESQQQLNTAEESMPVWIVGMDDVLETGQKIYFADSDKEAKKLAHQLAISPIDEISAENEATEVDDLSILASMLAVEQRNEEVKKLNVVVRTDTQGTLDVVISELKSLNNDEVEVNILSSGTGEITRKDVLTAAAAHGIVIGFQVVIPSDLVSIIQEEKVIVRVYSIIYDLIEEISDAMDGLIEPEEFEEEVARARVKKVFELSDGSVVAGSLVTSGKVIKGYKVWVEHNGEEIGRGKITSLKRNKDEVKEVQKSVECGILIEPKVEGIEENDEIVLYKLVKN